MRNATLPAIWLGALWSASVCLAQVPPWAVSHTHRDYPPAEYLLGVGYGTGEKGEETAKRLAQSDIAAQVRVKVQTEVRNVQQTYELNQNQEAYADFRIRSTAVVDERLTGAEIVETAVDQATNTTYALAALNKEKFAGTIAAELTDGWNQAAELRTKADEFVRRGNVNEAIADLIQARATATDLLPKQSLYDAVAAEPFHADPSLGPAALTSAIRDVLSRIRIDKIGGDQQRGKIGGRFGEPFTAKVVIAGGGTEVPVVGATVAFLGSSGGLLGEAVTDAGGRASLVIKVRGDIGSQVRAKLSIQSLNKEFASSMNSTSKAFACEVLNADVAFGLKIESTSPSLSGALHTAVERAVTKLGYQVVDMSRFVLKVVLQSGPASTIEGMGGTLTSVSSDISILLVDTQSATTLGSVMFNSKGVAKGRDAALEKSAEALAVDEDELASLLERAKN